MSGPLSTWWKCTACGTMTNDDRALDELMCERNRPNGPLVRHDWQPMPPKPETREVRTIRRLRALAAGYRARALRNGQAAASNCETCSEAAEQLERARIVAWLREVAGAVRAEAETQGDTVFGTVAAVQEKTIERLAYLIEEKGK